jgi:hypothetical protein
MMASDLPKRPKWLTVVLVVLPVWLLASGGVTLWILLHREGEQAKAEQQRFAQSVSIPMIADDLKKIVEIIGERNGANENAAKNLTRTASMIEGLLGPTNTGYSIRRERGPADWPLIQITLQGKKPELPAVWVLASYDSRPGSPGVEANATGLAATLAAAQALAGDSLGVNVHFVFLPHANDPESPVLETATKFKQMADSPKSVLCVEAMGAGEELWFSSRDVSTMPDTLIQGLGKIRGAEVICLGEDVDLASILFEMGLPAVRVSTRPLVTPAEPDARPAFAPTVAASAGRLVELIRRSAGFP